MKRQTSTQLLTYPEASHRLGVGVSCLRKWVRMGRLPQVRVGTKATRIPIEAVEDLIRTGWKDTLDDVIRTGTSEAIVPGGRPAA